MDDQDDELASAVLPAEAAVPRFVMARLGGRDQSAAALARGAWDAFERPLPHYLFRWAHDEPGLCVDVGANTGFYTLLALAASQRNRVVAVEPVPSILELLDRNVRCNRMHGRAHLVGVAAGAANGRAELYFPPAEHGLIETSASLNRAFNPAHSAVMPVSVRTLDRILLRPSLLRHRIPLIKIDVEGHEAAVIAGARWTIRRHRPVLFVEVLPAADTQSLTGFLARADYADVRLPADRPPEVCREVAFDMAAWNHALVPSEKLDRFLALAPPPQATLP